MKVLMLHPELAGFNCKHLGVSLLMGLFKREGVETGFFDTAVYDQTAILPDPTLRKKDITPVYWFPKSKKQLPRPATMHLDVVEQFVKKLEDFNPDAIFVSTTYLSFKLGANLVAAARVGDRPVIYGGVHCTTAPELAIAHPGVTHIHLGEGEASLPVILAALKQGRPLDDCPNLWIKQADGAIRKNELLPVVQDLDSLPFYDWDHYDSDYYFRRIYQGEIYRMGDYAISRGCYNNCAYCFNKQFFERYEMPKKIIRHYSVDRAIEEMAHLRDKYDLNFIKLQDSDLFNKSEEYLEEFSRRYATHVNVPLTVNGCVGFITPSRVRSMVRMNVRSVSIGLESGSPFIRDEVLHRQKYSNQAFVDRIRLLRDAGLRVTLPAMFGVPHETRANVFETIELARASGAEHADFGLFYPFPNLTLTNYALEHGYLDPDRSLDDVAFGLESALKLDIPQEELDSLLRCTILYMKLPKALWPLIRRAEADTYGGFWWNLLRRIYFFKLHHVEYFGNLLRESRRQRMLRTLADAASATANSIED